MLARFLAAPSPGKEESKGTRNPVVRRGEVRATGGSRAQAWSVPVGWAGMGVGGLLWEGNKVAPWQGADNEYSCPRREQMAASFSTHDCVEGATARPPQQAPAAAQTNTCEPARCFARRRLAEEDAQLSSRDHGTLLLVVHWG